MTITYNHLNLPRLFTWTSGSFNGNSVEILYDAAGTKLKKTVKTGATVNYTQEYIGGIEYRDGVREAIYHAEGRVKYTSPSTTRYEYTIKDHLGNARISFSDLNGNGVVNVTNVASTNEVLQENHYYPFGLNMDGKWMNDAALDNKYQYNGKEINDDFGLNWYNYGFRWYDAAIGRFPTVDPIASDFTFVTPYNYAENEPVANVDLWGLQKYKPKMKQLDKPSDLLSTKMLRNAWEGTKTIAIEIGSMFNELGQAISEALPDQGTPETSDYHNSSDGIDGTGVEVLSSDALNSNGTMNTPSAKNGADALIESADISSTGSDGGGILNDAANAGEAATKVSRAMNNFGRLIDDSRKIKDESSKLKVDTSYNLGPNVKIEKSSPDEQKKKQ